MNERGSNSRKYTRRYFVQVGLCAGAAAALPADTSRYILWGLGFVTWRSRGAGWPVILRDVNEAGFDGVEPFTPKFLNDESMGELAELLPKYPKLRMSSIYWSGPFNVASEHERLIGAQVWTGGGDPVAFFEKYKRRIIYMHYNDIRGYYRGLPGYPDNVVELGRGIIDFPALHRILKSVHCEGWITIDLDNARISLLERSKIQKEYIDRVLAPIYS